MKRILKIQQKIEFEGRIFISFGLVLIITLLSFFCFPDMPYNMAIIASWISLDPHLTAAIIYALVIVLVILASLLRMWAGSILTSSRMMAFRVQKNHLTLEGPYQLIRNPIYLADLIAFCGFALCLKPIGIALPVLLYIHYNQLVIYEEHALVQQFPDHYIQYKNTTPRFLPRLRNFKSNFGILRKFFINYDGFRHNAQYLLLIPGFIVSAITGKLVYAIIIGIPAVIDWAVIHTLKGVANHSAGKDNPPAGKIKALIHDRVFADLLYAQCWEDPQIDREAFAIQSDDIVFSITSGGCNLLSFLLDDPSKIVALDINPAQNYLLELKIAALRVLDYEELLAFTGVKESARRLEYYQKLRSLLSENALHYWDNQRKKILSGIIHSGRYEAYMHLLRKWFCMLMGKSIVERLYALNDCPERCLYYERKWNALRWRFFTQIFLSRFIMTMLFTRTFFDQLDESFSFGKHFRNRIKRAVTLLPLKENHFFSYILLGQYYNTDHLPSYLRKENFELIRKRLDRIHIVTCNCEEYFSTLEAGSISKFNFSNIFEWMPCDKYENILRETIRIAREGAIITYRNLLVPRSRPESLAQWIQPLKEKAASLYEKDLSFIYRAYVVEQITNSHGLYSKKHL